MVGAGLIQPVLKIDVLATLIQQIFNVILANLPNFYNTLLAYPLKIEFDLSKFKR